MESITPPEGFRHQAAIQVRWGDMDALGHVNNAVFLSYMEQARAMYVSDLDLWQGGRGSLGMILARVEIDFKTPLFAGDDVRVFTRTVRLGNSSLKLAQWIARVKAGQAEIAAQALFTAVVYDYATNKSTPMPERWRGLIKAYEITPPSEA
ncbi:MAG TPA: thioesterase family protein [Phototrophicaceae bacterium]|nr:thioesterase family protein [Phototrophicaceae bacterium]